MLYQSTVNCSSKSSTAFKRVFLQKICFHMQNTQITYHYLTKTKNKSHVPSLEPDC